MRLLPQHETLRAPRRWSAENVGQSKVLNSTELAITKPTAPSRNRPPVTGQLSDEQALAAGLRVTPGRQALRQLRRLFPPAQTES